MMAEAGALVALPEPTGVQQHSRADGDGPVYEVVCGTLSPL